MKGDSLTAGQMLLLLLLLLMSVVVVADTSVSGELLESKSVSFGCLAASATSTDGVRSTSAKRLIDCAVRCLSMSEVDCLGVEFGDGVCKTFTEKGLGSSLGSFGHCQSKEMATKLSEFQLTFINCSLSSGFEGNTFPCSLALDSNFNNFAHTGAANRDWWQGTLTVTAFVTRVAFYNRLDCCQFRMNNFGIEVDGVRCATHASVSGVASVELTCNVRGRVVRLQSERTDTEINFAEIVVFGHL